MITVDPVAMSTISVCPNLTKFWSETRKNDETSSSSDTSRIPCLSVATSSTCAFSYCWPVWTRPVATCTTVARSSSALKSTRTITRPWVPISTNMLTWPTGQFTPFPTTTTDFSPRRTSSEWAASGDSSDFFATWRRSIPTLASQVNWDWFCQLKLLTPHYRYVETTQSYWPWDLESNHQVSGSLTLGCIFDEKL